MIRAQYIEVQHIEVDESGSHSGHISHTEVEHTSASDKYPRSPVSLVQFLSRVGRNRLDFTERERPNLSQVIRLFGLAWRFIAAV
jgi:hypothetical protein